MNTKEAKDFLADQAAQQAALDRTPLSDLEKRMMYFTESDPASCNDPIGLNDEFEAQYETAKYESKMSTLLHDAYKRLKADNPQGKRYWDEAVSTLEKGDHYVLVLWGQIPSPINPSNDPGSNVVKYGAMFIVGVFLVAGLSQNANIPAWVFWCLGILMFVLFFVTMFFLAQQAYRALSRHKQRPD